MPKTITSPVEKYPGSVTLADPLNYPQYLAWKAAINSARDCGDDVDARLMKLLPGICVCVSEWKLEGLGQLAPDTFPATPRMAAMELAGWLVREITSIVTGTDGLPNE